MDEPNPFEDQPTRNYGANPQESAVPDVPVDPLPAKNLAGSITAPSYYASCYQIDYEKFRARVKCALTLHPLHETDTEARNESELAREIEPDLYGPVWLAACTGLASYAATTLTRVVRSAVMGQRLAHPGDRRLVTALVIAYLYAWGTPAVVHVMARLVLKLESQWPLTRLITVYGYSLAVWIPLVALTGVLRVVLAHGSSRTALWATVWGVRALGLLHSGAFFYRQICGGGEDAQSRPLLVTCLAASAVSALLLSWIVPHVFA
ncbi:LAQU0S06e03510g1_1 [Lachancea quebecensis]|uniref:LAQU0S06e03510g1_1 n=1 Tax=Lachancea quebecensis TaxID=1654605 RepID=A0A0P1KSH9_9SACH|nr:LAQU0S06e03510g1_1 [Lachancea quebecensis]